MPSEHPSPPVDTPRYVEVAVDFSLGISRTFTYSIPPNIFIHPGQLVLVPFGPRLLSGLIWEVDVAPQVEGIRQIVSLQQPNPVLTQAQLQLVAWLSRNTHAGIYECALPMLPFDYRQRLRRHLRLTAEAKDALVDRLPVNQQRIVQYIGRHRETTQEDLLKRKPSGSITSIRELIQSGLVEEEWKWKKPPAGPVFESLLTIDPGNTSDQSAIDKLLFRSPKQRELLSFLAINSPVIASDARRQFGHSVVSSLTRIGMARIEKRRRTRDPLVGISGINRRPGFIPSLTEPQRAAVDKVKNTMSSETPGHVFLLYGPTGSGKTEVYLHSLSQCLSAGKKGIFLVPEISMTADFITRLEGRFPGKVALLHSSLTAGEQYDTWWRIHNGEFDVVLGPRSAIFAPQPNLGLIIVDEEHESAYKQTDQRPYYNARDVAIKLADLQGITIILGSATPDIGTYKDALEGRFTTLRLPTRIRSGPHGETIPGQLAKTTIVDMREELRMGVRGIFSRPLDSAIRECLSRNEQIILYLNRRGTAGIVQCRECGHVIKCKSCDYSLTYHADGEYLLCHHCGRRYPTTKSCPECSSERIRYLGLGTQKVAQEVETTFNVPVLRWDRDTTIEKNAHLNLLTKFRQNEAPILVGTQMIAQGLDLPNVTLVGVILADLGLHLPDFRSGERSFQLLSQVSGRSGRGDIQGRVIIQTYVPDHYVIMNGALQDYESFFETELAYRNQYKNPPFSRIARCAFQDTNVDRCRQTAESFAKHLRNITRQRGLLDIAIIGPTPMIPSKRRGKFRWQLLIRIPVSPLYDLPDTIRDLSIPSDWGIELDPLTIN